MDDKRLCVFGVHLPEPKKETPKKHPWAAPGSKPRDNSKRDYAAEHQRRSKAKIAENRANSAFVGGYIPKDVVQALDEKSKSTGLPKTRILTKALKEYLGE